MDQKQYWARNPSEYHYHSIEKLAKSFQSFHAGLIVRNSLQNQGYDKRTTDTSTKSIKPQRISNWEIFKACLSRELLLLKRNSALHIFKTIQISFVAFVITTLFLRTRMSHQTVMDGNIYLGALFIGIMIVNFNGLTELAMTVKRLPIFYKQRELLNLPGWAVISSICILSIPISLLETGIWTGLTYYGIGFAPSPTRFFRHFLILVVMHQMSMSLYRFIATVGRTQVVANVFGTSALTTIVVLGGYLIARGITKQCSQPRMLDTMHYKQFAWEP